MLELLLKVILDCTFKFLPILSVNSGGSSSSVRLRGKC